MTGAPHGLAIVTETSAGVTTLSVAGDFDATQVDTFEHAIGALPDDASTMTVDVSGCTIIDSAALGALIRLKLRLDEQGASLRLIAGRPFQRQILENTGLVEFLGLVAPTSGTTG